MKYFVPFIITNIIFICVAIGAFLFLLHKPSHIPTDKIIVIERGQGVQQIAKTLQSNKLVSNHFIFMVGAKLLNNGAPLQAGEYEIPPHATPADILTMLQSGEVIQRRFTVPEGLTSWEIVQLIKTVDGLNTDDVNLPPEGTLMPDTYHYIKGDTGNDKIKHMQKALIDFQETLDLSVLDNLPLTDLNDVMILASIVEKDTSVPDEYKRVAGVFINRLRIGMPLQTDPTVIYGITMGRHQNDGKGPLGRRLLRKDLRVDTPYNTYTRQSLPPTPICNPGRAAINAVLSPENHDYLYFVADGTGGHAFAKTLEDHNKNVAKWRKVRSGD